MAYAKSVRNSSAMQLPRNSVGTSLSPIATTKADCSVSPVGCSAAPKPASRVQFGFNIFPKSNLKGYLASSHFASPVRVVRAVRGVEAVSAVRPLSITSRD